MIDSISKDVKISTLTIFWQFIIKGIDELSVVANPILSLEMLIVRLIHLKDMPSYESVLDLLNKNSSKQSRENLEDSDDKKINLDKKNEINQVSKDQIKNTTQTKPKLTSLKPKTLTENLNLETISSFEDLIKLASKKREVELKYDLERNVKLIKFSEGKIDINFDENIGKNFVRNLTEKLLKWTGKRWLITFTKSTDQKTFLEHQSINKKKLLEEEEKGEVYKKFKNIFSDGELVEVSKKE